MNQIIIKNIFKKTFSCKIKKGQNLTQHHKIHPNILPLQISQATAQLS